MPTKRQGLDSLDDRPGYALKRASTALHRVMEEAVRPHGLTIAQYACLEILARNPETSNADLARGAFVTRQAAHQVLQRLLDKNLVTCTGDPRHARRQRLTLTREGERHRKAAATAVDQVERTITSALPAGAAATLAVHLQEVTTALSRDAGT